MGKERGKACPLLAFLPAVGQHGGPDGLRASGWGRQQESGSLPGRESGDWAEAEKLVVTYQTLPTSVLEDLDQVTAAVNEIAREEIGAEIVFRLADESDAFTQYPLWISKDERIDLMMLGGQDIATYVSRGMLRPLDSLLETYGKEIGLLMEEGVYVTEGAVVKGRTYGVAPVPDLPGNGYGLWTCAELVRETGIAYEAEHIYTWEELTDFLEYMRQWYREGYIYPDAAFTDAYPEELIESGLVLTYPGSSAPGYEMEALFGEDALCLRTTGGEPGTGCSAESGGEICACPGKRQCGGGILYGIPGGDAAGGDGDSDGGGGAAAGDAIIPQISAHAAPASALLS